MRKPVLPPGLYRSLRMVAIARRTASPTDDGGRAPSLRSLFSSICLLWAFPPLFSSFALASSRWTRRRRASAWRRPFPSSSSLPRTDPLPPLFWSCTGRQRSRDCMAMAPSTRTHRDSARLWFLADADKKATSRGKKIDFRLGAYFLPTPPAQRPLFLPSFFSYPGPWPVALTGSVVDADRIARSCVPFRLLFIFFFC